MARTSRKNAEAVVKTQSAPKTEYSAALYARISVENERKGKLIPSGTKFNFFVISQGKILISVFMMCIVMMMSLVLISSGRSFPA